MRFVSLLLCWSLSAVAQAQPLIVIHDNGQAKPLASLQTNQKPAPVAEEPKQRSLSDVMRAHFPLHSQLSVGVPEQITDRTILTYLKSLPRPLFLIGADETSAQWLVVNRLSLIERDAIGFVVQAQSYEQYQRLQLIAGNQLILIPSTGDQLAQLLQLKHYPVLITAQGLAQ